jgi:hypothetical protein
MMPARAVMVVVLLAWPAAVGAQDVSDLLRRIEALERTLQEQAREIDELKRQLPTAKPQAPPPGTPTQAAPPPPPVVADRAEQRTAELPPDQVAAAQFPGSFPIPGSDAALKIGGLVRVNWVSTSDALLVDDRFVTSAIPVEGTEDASKGSRVKVSAQPSRFNFDLRTPTGVGSMRAFIEADFAGSNNTLRLRHAYGQWKGVIFGQTWSTFADPEAEPDGIDFEGLNAIVLFRQAQVRWTIAPHQQMRVALAFEDPHPDLTGADGINQVPDFIGRIRWEPKRGGHLQGAGLLRQIRGAPTDRPNDVVSDLGWGITMSGRLPSPIFSERDQFMFEHNQGAGIGRYVTDLSSEGGQDGVYDAAAHEMRALPAYAGYVGYEHWWSERLRSSISFGIVAVDNLDMQTDDSLHLTRRYSTNLTWSPIPRLDLVSEFLWGVRINRDGRRGRANQTQIGATFRF